MIFVYAKQLSTITAILNSADSLYELMLPLIVATLLCVAAA
jgi:hypothetical protein